MRLHFFHESENKLTIATTQKSAFAPQKYKIRQVFVEVVHSKSLIRL
jgi:hypothetical protein